MALESLAKRYFLILGGSSGIGFATARYLLTANSIVTIAGRNAQRLENAKARLLAEAGAEPSRLRVSNGDACDEAAVKAAVAMAANPSGELDGIFIPAGYGTYLPLLDHTLDLARNQFEANVFPLMNALQCGVPAMKAKGGSIVAVSSTAAAQTAPGFAAYGSAKAALEYYVRCAANELGPLKIRVNAVRPGLTKTEMTADHIHEEKWLAAMAEITPLGAYGLPEDFAPMVSLLLSPETSWITGQLIAIDGGLCLRGYGKGVFPSGPAAHVTGKYYR
jgi:NAD(P)-dependent dehydrogenase (short-subunit alcohol dehydrogenase family)